MTVAACALDVLLTTAAAYNVAVTLVAWRFRRGRRATDAMRAGWTPGVSILVPLAGAEPGLSANLAAYCRLEYAGAVQLVVGSLDPRDPALGIAHRVARRHPGTEVRIVAGARDDLGPNRKAGLLTALARAARHPVIAAIDSDVRVRPDYLRRLLPVLERPGVGLVTCYYRAPRPHTLAQAYEALCINADFIPAVMLATVLGRADVAFGSSLMLRRETLDAIGGFPALVQHLADDHRLAELVIDRGEAVVVAPYVVESDPHPASLAAALRHQLRWARTTRVCAPFGYAASIVTHGTTFTLLAVLPIAPLAAPRLLFAAAVLLLRLVAAEAGARALGVRLGWSLWLVPARDLVASALWAASFAGDRIEWRGRRYRLRADGRLAAEGRLAADARASARDHARAAGEVVAAARVCSEMALPGPRRSSHGAQVSASGRE